MRPYWPNSFSNSADSSSKLGISARGGLRVTGTLSKTWGMLSKARVRSTRLSLVSCKTRKTANAVTMPSPMKWF